MSEITVRFEAGGSRCFVGKGYSDEYCLQTFDTLQEARAHSRDYHASPETDYIVKITEEYLAGEED